MMRRTWTWAALVFSIACSGEDRPKAIPPEGTAATTGIPAMGGGGGAGGRVASGGKAGTGDLGGESGEGGETSDPDGPTARITSPAEVLDPDDGEVLMGTEVDVVCEVAPAGPDPLQAVDPTKVRIAVVDALGKETAKAGVSTGNAGAFSARFPIAAIESGPLSFRCSAADQAKPARMVTTEISTFVDHGPSVTVRLPAPESAYPLEGAIPFEFSVEPVPLRAGDQGAALGEVTLMVDGVPITGLREDRTTPGLFSVAVDFTDSLLFPEPPADSVTVDIRAENRRSPTPAVHTESYGIVIDAAGPVISVTSPRTGSIVGDQVNLKFSVTDVSSGVDPTSVAVTLNLEEYVFGVNGEWAENKGAYTFTFDSTKLSSSSVQATVNIRASDLAGNAAKGESLLLYLDNEPPVVLLDPPNIRLLKRPVPTDPICSVSFDPLGLLAANDGQTILNAHMFRTLVWDKTNTLPGHNTEYYSGANQASARLYVQPEPSQPLLVDTDADGYCDEVDVAGTTILEMTALSTQGAIQYSLRDPDDLPAPLPTVCRLREEVPPPRKLCADEHSDMTVVIRHSMSATPAEPAVYALDPQSGGLDCTGRTWEVFSVVGREGWVCMAARAEDKALNHGISPPLRVCLNDATDDATAGGTTAPCAGVVMPTCTDGCIPPPNVFPVDPILELK